MDNKPKQIFNGRIIKLEVEKVELPNGSVCDMEIIRHPGGSAVVALDIENRVCMLKQYRYVVDDWVWELPAGKIDDQEPPFETAKRELEEEAGVIASQWDELGYMISSPGVFDEKVYLYLAQDLKEVMQQPEEHEVFEIHWVDFEEAMEWAYNGKISDGKTIVALARSKNMLKF